MCMCVCVHVVCVHVVCVCCVYYVCKCRNEIMPHRIKLPTPSDSVTWEAKTTILLLTVSKPRKLEQPMMLK